ncbi:MAG: hypothetical protein ACRCU2_18025 [Planktothrix sp.]
MRKDNFFLANYQITAIAFLFDKGQSPILLAKNKDVVRFYHLNPTYRSAIKKYSG